MKKREDIMKIFKSLEKSGLLIQGITETFKNKAKKIKIKTFSNVITNISC